MTILSRLIALFRPRVIVVTHRRERRDDRARLMATTAKLARELGRPNPLRRA